MPDRRPLNGVDRPLFLISHLPDPMRCIHHHELYHDLGFTGLLQFAHDQVQAVTTLGDAKLRLHFIALARLLNPFVAFLGIDSLCRSAQFWANHRDVLALAEPQILPGPISFVPQNALRPTTKPAKVGIALFNQQTTLTEIVPTDFVDKGVAILDADRDLGAEFDIASGFSADNWRICGWEILTMRSSTRWAPLLNICSCWMESWPVWSVPAHSVDHVPAWTAIDPGFSGPNAHI